LQKNRFTARSYCTPSILAFNLFLTIVKSRNISHRSKSDRSTIYLIEAYLIYKGVVEIYGKQQRVSDCLDKDKM
jgi:hypothetical protein